MRALLTGVVVALAMTPAPADAQQAARPEDVATIDGIIKAYYEVVSGPAGETAIPEGAEIHEANGKVIMPGLVDTHSHIGGGWAADRSEPIQPGVRMLDSINARDSGFQRARAGGLTTLNVMPGSGHLMSGQTVYLKLRASDTIDGLLIQTEDGGIAGGMKMANGTNSRRDPPFPGTRGKSAALVRQKFLEAQAYRKKLAAGAKDPDKMQKCLVTCFFMVDKNIILFWKDLVFWGD